MSDDSKSSAFQAEYEASLADPYGEDQERLEMPFSDDVLQLRPVGLLSYALAVTNDSPMEETVYEAVSMLLSSAATTSAGEWNMMRQVLLAPLQDAVQWAENNPMIRISLIPRLGADLKKKIPVTVFRTDYDELVKLGMPVQAAHALSTFPLSQTQLDGTDTSIAEPYLLDERPEMAEGTLAVAAGFISEMLKTHFYL